MSAEINEVIRSAAMLVSYHTRRWSASVSDAESAKLIAQATGSPAAAHKVSKNLMHGSDTRLKAIASAQEAGRREHQAMTLQWSISAASARGPRILPNARWMEYMQKVGKAQNDYKRALQEFLDNYESDALAARQALNMEPPPPGLYPTREQLEKLFSLKVDFSPIPSGSQFTGLPPEIASHLEQSYEDRMQSRIQNAMDEALGRVREHVEHLLERLKIEEPRLRASALEHVREAASLIKGFNVMGDPRLDELADACTAAVQGLTHTTLNKSEALRSDVANEVKSVLDKMEQWGL